MTKLLSVLLAAYFASVSYSALAADEAMAPAKAVPSTSAATPDAKADAAAGEKKSGKHTKAKKTHLAKADATSPAKKSKKHKKAKKTESAETDTAPAAAK